MLHTEVFDGYSVPILIMKILTLKAEYSLWVMSHDQFAICLSELSDFLVSFEGKTRLKVIHSLIHSFNRYLLNASEWG